MSNTKWNIDGDYIRLSGLLDAQEVDGLETVMNADNVTILDFDGVTGIKFSALRYLLRCRQSGKRFYVVNANSDVAEMFEDTGVSSFINVCRKPKPLQIGKYSEFGGGFLSTAYNSEDGDSMIKVYGKNVPPRIVYQEKNVARAVMVFGLPTPLVGSIYTDGDNKGLDFERIEGKRSFSRIISEQPERLEEMTRRFARMCKQLHATECDTNIFSDRTLFYRKAVLSCKDITEEERAKAIAFLDSVPSKTTCLHGDMQPSNVITNEKEDLWIDLSDFGYGNPMFDMGMWFFLSRLNDEERSQHVFHLGVADMARCWDVFVEEYFGADTPEKKAAVERDVEPFAALHMLYLGSTYGFVPGMLDYVKAKLLR